MYTLIIYPNCSNCKKLITYMKDKNIEIRDITKIVPTVAELKKWHKELDVDIKKFFNTSGKVYKEMELSKKIKDLSDDEKFQLLASNGMLIKRPIILKDGKCICVGKFEGIV